MRRCPDCRKVVDAPLLRCPSCLLQRMSRLAEAPPPERVLKCFVCGSVLTQMQIDRQQVRCDQYACKRVQRRSIRCGNCNVVIENPHPNTKYCSGCSRYQGKAVS